MKVAFYLPVVTPWWFENIVVHLIRRLSASAEVHVLVPPMWSGTGIGIEQLQSCIELDDVQWHILDGDDHPALRTSGAGSGVIELMHEIAPDYVLCRSADIETPAQFPGVVRYMMEGGIPPFPTEQHWIVLQSGLFEHGSLPAMAPDLRARLDNAFSPAWSAVRRRLAAPDGGRDRALERAGLPSGRVIVSLPLEYDHQENFFGRFAAFPHNIDLIDAVADKIGDDMFLAITDHPLNERFGDRRSLLAQIEQMDGQAGLVPNGKRGKATNMLARYADGVVVQNGKSFSVAAFFGTPTMRASTFESGEWLRTYRTLEDFLAAIRSGEALAPDEADARTWFAYHLANNILDPTRPDLSAEDVFGHMDRPFDPGRWEQGIARYARHNPELFA